MGQGGQEIMLERKAGAGGMKVFKMPCNLKVPWSEEN